MDYQKRLDLSVSIHKMSEDRHCKNDFFKNEQICTAKARTSDAQVLKVVIPEVALCLQVNETEILQSWVDSADWMEGIEYHVASVPPKSGFSRCTAALTRCLVACIS